MRNTWQRISVLIAVAASLGLPAQAVVAQEEELIEEVVTTGTRSKKERSASDSPVPIDAFNEAALDMQPVGDMTENLKNLVPSFSATPFTGDASSVVRPVSLRGLPPDETLLLVNGKRRHRGALLALFGAAMARAPSTAPTRLPA
jgi:iron complex outermembrane receptor protein